MAAVVITFNGTRVNDSDANTDWGNWGAAGGAPASEAPLAYQRSTGSAATVGAVNKKINSTSLGGIDYDPGANPQDMRTVTGTKTLWFVKAYVADAFDLNTTEGLRLGIGSANNAYTYYNCAGTGAANPRYDLYPPQGGYLITAINPNISGWGTNSGSPDLQNIDWWGVQAAFINGEAKSENLALDAIDVGTGLTIVGGDGGTADGTFTDLVTEDQDTQNNRWGVVTGAGQFVRANGLLTVGSATATGFTDDTSILVFPDGYHGTGDVGVAVGLQSASSVINIGCLIISEGSLYTTPASTDTRADFTVTGTSGTLALSAQLNNFRNIILTSATTVDGANLESADLTVGGSEIKNSIIRTNAASGVAMIDDAVFGTVSGVHDTEFRQTGSGHAIEITTGTSFTFTNLDFTGYGGTGGSNGTASSGPNDAAIFNDTGGAITITIDGGDSPSVRNGAGATTTVIANATNYSARVVTVAGATIDNAKVFLEAADGTGPLPYQESVTIVNAGTTATVTHTGHGMDTGDRVVIRGASHLQNNGVFTITVSNVNTYTYTMASAPGSSPTGTITSTWVALFGDTVSGLVSSSRVLTAEQPVSGRARKSSSAPYYKNGPLVGTLPTSGNYQLTAVMIED